MASRGNLWTGCVSWHTSPGAWIRSYFYATNTLPPKIASYRAQLNGCLRLSHAERATLGEIGFRLGRKALNEVATVAQPDT